MCRDHRRRVIATNTMPSGDWRLEAAKRNAEAAHGTLASNSIDSLLSAMGSKRATVQNVAPAFAPRITGVGEAVWDPSVINVAEQASSTVAAPSVPLEIVRARALRRLQAAVEDALLDELGDAVCSRLEMHSRVTLRNGNGMVERWLFGSRSREPDAEGSDPLLPPPHRTAADVPGIVGELEAAGASAAAASAAASAMGSAATAALVWLNRQRRALPATPEVHVSAPSSAGQVELRCGKVKLALNHVHLLKMHELYRRTSQTAVALDDAGFRRALFCVLQRYESVGGAGLQAAISAPAFAVLRRRFGVSRECFASPFNCRYDSYCSAFPDVDVPFGSLGDFFDCFAQTPQGGKASGGDGLRVALEGSYEANPPFVPEVIERMARTINVALRAATAAGLALSFVVIVPDWSEGKACAALVRSPHLRRRLLAANRKHEYLEGAQHRKAVGSRRQATCDTAVYILQSQAGNERWPPTDAASDELLAALSGISPSADRGVTEANWAEGNRADSLGQVAAEAGEESRTETEVASAAGGKLSGGSGQRGAQRTTSKMLGHGGQGSAHGETMGETGQGGAGRGGSGLTKLQGRAVRRHGEGRSRRRAMHDLCRLWRLEHPALRRTG